MKRKEFTKAVLKEMDRLVEPVEVENFMGMALRDAGFNLDVSQGCLRIVEPHTRRVDHENELLIFEGVADAA